MPLIEEIPQNDEPISKIAPLSEITNEIKIESVKEIEKKEVAQNSKDKTTGPRFKD